jgi:hypothetical protein
MVSEGYTISHAKYVSKAKCDTLTFTKMLGMKHMKYAALLVGLLVACEEKEIDSSEFTGKEVVYSLLAGSDYVVSGTVTISEQKDGRAFIVTQLSGTEEGLTHPVHLHIGSLGTVDAEVAALLTPVLGSTGRSETTLARLANESPITYNELLELTACIKVHLAESGAGRNVILAGGNIGMGANDAAARSFMAVCK